MPFISPCWATVLTAVDQSEVGLAKAQRLAKARGVKIETLVTDLVHYTIVAGAWAGIVATFAHLPPALRQRVHGGVVAGLQPGGVYILEAYTPAQLAFGTGGPKSPELLMTLAGLRDELSGGITDRDAKLSAMSSKAVAIPAVAPWCKFLPAGMSNGFVQRGVWWVVGQFLLLLAIAVRGASDRATSKPLASFHLWCSACGLRNLWRRRIAGLGTKPDPFPKPSATSRFVRRGIYGLIRHPLYTAVFCAALGWSLVRHSWLALVVSLAMGIFLDAKARHEERWLREQFPEYASYEQRVRRFIPWIY